MLLGDVLLNSLSGRADGKIELVSRNGVFDSEHADDIVWLSEDAQSIQRALHQLAN